MRLAIDSSAELKTTLREIRQVEGELLAHGDLGALARFGDAQEGTRVASLLGFASTTAREARIVDQLRYFPSSIKLIREFLLLARHPEPSESYGIEDGQINITEPMNAFLQNSGRV